MVAAEAMYLQIATRGYLLDVLVTSPMVCQATPSAHRIDPEASYPWSPVGGRG